MSALETGFAAKQTPSPSIEEMTKALEGVTPDRLRYEADAMYEAVQGNDYGDTLHCDNWADKPHRVVFDAVSLLRQSADRIGALMGEVERLRNAGMTELAAECPNVMDYVKRSEITAALADTGKAETEAVKPLEWKKDRRKLYADTPFARAFYEIRLFPVGQDRWKHKLDIYGTGSGPLINDEGEAKAAAQADYEARIRSALVQPAPADAAVVEAWQPIGTAPKDGRPILVLDVLYCKPWHYECIWNGIQWYHGFGNSWPRANPTHWMHLPAPPALSSIPTSHTGEDGSAPSTKGISE